MPSYHDLHVTTTHIPRTSVFDLPFMIDVRCCRTAGWQVWDMSAIHGEHGKKIAGEFAADHEGLRLDVAGHVIVDSLPSASVSFPYLAVARRCGVGYGEVLSYVDWLDRFYWVAKDRSAVDRLHPWHDAVVDAFVRENTRRGIVE